MLSNLQKLVSRRLIEPETAPGSLAGKTFPTDPFAQKYANAILRLLAIESKAAPAMQPPQKSPEHRANRQTTDESMARALQFGDAESGLRHLLQQQPSQLDQCGDPTYHKELIRLLLAGNRFDDALVLTPSVTGPGRPGWHHILFARAYETAGSAGPAREHWTAWLALNPGDAEARAALSRLDAT